MSEYLDSTGLALYDELIKSYINAVSGNGNGVRIVTLPNAPTSSTTTYTIGASTYAFKVGDEIKANGLYYKLYDLTTENNTTTATWNPLSNSYSVMGASGTNHASGLVPDPGSTQGTTKYLREDGTWEIPTDTTYSTATTSVAGLMSATDKVKVDNEMNLINSNTTTGSLQLTPNTLYSLGTLTGALTITLGSVVAGIPNTYTIEFDIDDSASTPTKVPNFPASIVWREEPTWSTGKHYEISIRYSANTLTYYGLFAEFEVSQS